MSASLEFVAHLLGEAAVEEGRCIPVLLDGQPVTLGVACEEAGEVAARRRTPLVLVATSCGPVELPDGLAVVRVDGDPLGLAAADLSVSLGGEAHVDHAGLSPASAAELTRRFLSLLPASAAARPPVSAGNLTDCVPFALDAPYEIEAVLEAILDGTEGLVELRAGEAPEVVIGLGRLNGIGIGVVASRAGWNAGRLTSQGCRKVARVVGLCGRLHRPVLFLVDSAGLASAATDEQADLERLAHSLITVHSAVVPKLVLILGRAYGLAATMLAAVGARADYVGAWPRASLAMSAPGDETEVAQASVMRAARSGDVLDVIEPDRTRDVLIDVIGLMRGERTYNRG